MKITSVYKYTYIYDDDINKFFDKNDTYYNPKSPQLNSYILYKELQKKKY